MGCGAGVGAAAAVARSGADAEKGAAAAGLREDEPEGPPLKGWLLVGVGAAAVF